jgi:CheY-like chemotaxis protein
MTDSGLILVVDDNEMNRDVMQRRLERQGYGVITAEDGARALELMAEHAFDLLLLDIMMPEVNGYEVLQRIKADPIWMHIPVIVISAVDHLESVVKCVEMGADDYLFKPFNPILLKARIGASLDKKRLRDQEQQLLAQSRGLIEAAVRLPAFARDRLGDDAGVVDRFSSVAVLVVAVEGLSELALADETAHVVGKLFGAFDAVAKQYGLYRLRASGNTMMFVGGQMFQPEDGLVHLGSVALEMARVVAEQPAIHGTPLRIRIGMDIGSAVGGVVHIGEMAYYDLWGDAVTNATHLQLSAPEGGIWLSQAVRTLLTDQYDMVLHDSYAGVYVLR